MIKQGRLLTWITPRLRLPSFNITTPSMATGLMSTPVKATPIVNSVARAQPSTPRPLTCVLCAQRKVKCDKLHPCNNCVKAGVECVPTIPNPSRKRKRKVDGVEDLLARCKRYETLLLSCGATKEMLENGDMSLIASNSGLQELRITAASLLPKVKSVAPSHIATLPGKKYV